MCARRRNRGSKLEHMLFSQDGGKAMRALKYISSGKGESMVNANKARRLYSANGEAFLGYVLVAGEQAMQKLMDPEKVSPALTPFSCTFTRGEVELLQVGASHTAAMRDEWKKHGLTLPLDVMDAAEAARVKQSVYRSTH